jgi:hypothetical protein
MIADDDEVRLEHAADLYRSLPDAELAVVPGTSHGLLVEPGLCNLVITEFLHHGPGTDIRSHPPRRSRVTDRLPRLLKDLDPQVLTITPQRPLEGLRPLSDAAVDKES